MEPHRPSRASAHQPAGHPFTACWTLTDHETLDRIDEAVEHLHGADAQAVRDALERRFDSRTLCGDCLEVMIFPGHIAPIPTQRR